MIHMCTCSRAAASTPKLPRERRRSKECENCGGERVVNARGCELKGTVNNGGLELLRLIGPHLNWRMASNCRQRSARRARTSFPGGNQKHHRDKVSKESKDLICREQKLDMPVSESEKLGLSVLGMHFSDTTQSVPIKKRRFMLVSSSSTSQSPFNSDDSGQIIGSHSASHEETGSNVGQIPEVNSGIRAEEGHYKIFANEDAYLVGMTEKDCKLEDFSGISLLAAAACDSNIDCYLSNTEVSVPVESYSGQEGNSRSAKPLPLPKENYEQLSETFGPMDVKVDSGNISNGNNAEAPLSHRGPATSLHSSQGGKASKITSPSQCNKCYWDLNTDMDKWEIPFTEVTNSKSLTTNIVSGDSISDEKSVKHEAYEGQAVEVVDCTACVDILPRNNCAIREPGEQEKLTSFYDDLAADHEGGKECISIPCKGGSTQEEYAGKDVAADSEKEKADANHVVPCEDNFFQGGNGLKDVDGVMEEEKTDSQCVIDGPMGRVATKIEQSIHALPDVKTDATKYHRSVDIGTKVSASSSEAMIPDITDRPHPDGALCSQGTCKSSVEGYANRQYDADLNDHLDSGYDSNASHVNANHRIELEEGEISGDEDSQYEDGELRGSVMNSWGEYGDEEEEIERVDYESENIEAVVFESADCPASDSLHTDGVECKNQLFSEVVNVYNGSQVGKKDAQDDVFETFLQGSSITDTSDEGSGERSVGSIRRTVMRSEKLNTSLKVDPWNGSGSDKVSGGVLLYDNNTKELSHSAGLKRNSSGCQSSGDRLVDSRIDSDNWDLGSVRVDAFTAGDSTKWVGESVSRRKLASIIERPESNLPCRKDRSSRSPDGSSDPSPRFGGNSGTPRSFSKGGSFLCMPRRGRGRGKCEYWAGSSHYQCPTRGDSSGCYGSARFSNCAPRNAVAATAAKVESNGFVVAPDGTLVKSGGGRADRVAGRRADAFSHSTRPSLSRRDSPVERDGSFHMSSRYRNLREMSPGRRIYFDGKTDKYGHSIVRTGQRERYRGTLRDTDYPLTKHRPSSMGERSFAPLHRRPLHHSRSPSRCRNHSPRLWRSYSGRNEYGMNEASVLRRRSRSPSNFRFEARLERVRSPHQPTDSDRVLGYGPSSRNRKSPSHASSLFVEMDDDLPDRMREHVYRRSSGRSSPLRAFSRSSRVDNLDSQKRRGKDEYFQPNQAAKSADFVDVGKGSRHKRDDDRRAHADRIDTSHSSRQFYIDGSMKHFCNDAEHSFQGANSQTSVPGVFEQRRGSLRGFDRGIASEDGASPERVKEELGHFTDGKYLGSVKTYADNDVDDDMASEGQ